MNATTFHQGHHLTEAELLPAIDSCPACLGTAERRPILVVQSSPRVELRGCAACGAASASRMPRPEVLARYYRDYYEGREQRITVGDATRFGAAIARHLEVTAGAAASGLRILDFGGGDGSLGVEVARSLAARTGRPGSEVTVVDITEPSNRPVPGVVLRSARRLADLEGRFEVVLASAVLEHIPDLRDAAASLFARVAPGGYFYSRTPYLAPVARLFRNLDLTYPAHVHDLGPAFWNRAVETFSLDARIVRSGPSPVEADLRAHPVRALVTHLLKLPGHLETRLLGASRRKRLWHWVGGWEVVLRFGSRATR